MTHKYDPDCPFCVGQSDEVEKKLVSYWERMNAMVSVSERIEDEFRGTFSKIEERLARLEQSIVKSDNRLSRLEKDMKDCFAGATYTEPSKTTKEVLHQWREEWGEKPVTEDLHEATLRLLNACIKPVTEQDCQDDYDQPHKLFKDDKPSECEDVNTFKIGDKVIVYDRYLFAVPVKGWVTDISSKDGALQVDFEDDNPGGPNVIKHNGKYFHFQCCRLLNA